MSKPPTWAVESAKELRRLSALASEGVVELVAALDAALVVMCSGVVGCRRDGALLELRLDRRGPVSGDVAGQRQDHQLEEHKGSREWMLEGDIDLQVMPFVSGLLALDFARPSLRRMATFSWMAGKYCVPFGRGPERVPRKVTKIVMMRPNPLVFVSDALL